MIFLAIIILVVLLRFVGNVRDYKDSSYYQITKLAYSKVRHDAGFQGEYLTFEQLRNFEDIGWKFLFNLYIPKGNGETTEIDLLLISPCGLFVIESKNYSGWIFGDASQKNWMQTLPRWNGQSHKEYFYNPIMQNRTHIKYLKSLVGNEMPIHSVIVFSDHCTLKQINLNGTDVSVVYRSNVARTVAMICSKSRYLPMSVSQINGLFTQLYPYSQADHIVKSQHIETILKQKN